MLRIPLLLLVFLLAPPALALEGAATVTLGVDVGGTNVSAGMSPVPEFEAAPGDAGMSPVPEFEAAPGDAGMSPVPEAGAVSSPPPPAPPELPTYRPDGSVLYMLAGTLKLKLPDMRVVSDDVVVEFRGDRDGGFEKVAVVGDGVNLLYNESFVDVLLGAMEDLASDELRVDAGVGLLGIPKAKVKSVESHTKIRMSGDIEIDTGVRILEGGFVFKAMEPTDLD